MENSAPPGRSQLGQRLPEVAGFHQATLSLKVQRHCSVSGPHNRTTQKGLFSGHGPRKRRSVGPKQGSSNDSIATHSPLSLGSKLSQFPTWNQCSLVDASDALHPGVSSPEAPGGTVRWRSKAASGKIGQTNRKGRARVRGRHPGLW